MLATLPATIATLLLSYLFVVGGWQKLAGAARFRQVISDYRVAPASWSPWIARGLPFVELGAGLALLIPAARAPALGAVALLLTLYSAAIALNMARGRRDLDCGCAGPGQEQTISAWLLGRNLLLIALALLSGSVVHAIQLGWLGWCTAFLGAGLAALLYHVFNQLVANNNLLRRIARHG